MEQLERFEAPDEVIAAARARLQKPEVEFGVWEENWPLVQLFVCLQTDWRVAVGMAGIVYFGIEKQAIESTLRMTNTPVDEWPERLRLLKLMESAALPLLNSKL